MYKNLVKAFKIIQFQESNYGNVINVKQKTNRIEGYAEFATELKDQTDVKSVLKYTKEMMNAHTAKELIAKYATRRLLR